MIELTDSSVTDWLDRLPPDRLTLLYKHSPRCGLSFCAAEEVAAFAAASPEVPVFRLDVVARRNLARELGRVLDVPHHSPQVILLQGTRVRWHTSHHRITAEVLARQVQLAGGPTRP